MYIHALYIRKRMGGKRYPWRTYSNQTRNAIACGSWKQANWARRRVFSLSGADEVIHSRIPTFPGEASPLPLLPEISERKHIDKAEKELERHRAPWVWWGCGSWKQANQRVKMAASVDVLGICKEMFTLRNSATLAKIEIQGAPPKPLTYQIPVGGLHGFLQAWPSKRPLRHLSKNSLNGVGNVVFAV
ncbi:hypothetical protein VTK56DRAFT_843 [Thermocarpiscus australiensis]